ARVRVRRTLLPLLETFNPRAAESLARAAGLLREESSALEGFAARLLEDARAEVGKKEVETKSDGVTMSNATQTSSTESDDANASHDSSTPFDAPTPFDS